MAPASLDLIGGRITIPSRRVAGVTTDEIGNKGTRETAALNHFPQQLARTVAIEGSTGAVATEAPRGNSNKHDVSGNVAIARDDTRTAAYQSRASDTAPDRSLQPQKRS